MCAGVCVSRCFVISALERFARRIIRRLWRGDKSNEIALGQIESARQSTIDVR